jgi:membrane-associated phospholipid phosphatase
MPAMHFRAALRWILAIALWSGTSIAGEAPSGSILETHLLLSGAVLASRPTLAGSPVAPQPVSDGGPFGSRPIPFLSSAATVTSSSTAMGFTYGNSVAGQLVGSAAVVGLGFLLNSTIQPGEGQGTVVDDVGSVLGSPIVLVGGTGLVALDGWRTDRQDVLDTSKDLALALGATYATVGILKATVHEERPDYSDDNSFPSGHAAGAFAVASVLDRRYGGAVGWVAYGTATFITASRMIGDHHWLQDVVTGAVIGHFYGWLFTRGD